MAALVTISDSSNDAVAELALACLHTFTTALVRQDSMAATTENRTETASVNTRVVGLGTKSVLATVIPARKTQAIVAATPAILAKRAILS
jgi:hypothetical protein